MKKAFLLCLVFALLQPFTFVGASAQSSSRALQSTCQLTWRGVGHPKVGTILDVHAVSDDDVWFTAKKGFLHWVSNRWMVIPYAHENAIVSRIFRDNTNNLWVSAFYPDTSQLVILRWDGQQWTESLEPQGAFLGIYISPSLDAWVLTETHRYQWNGTSWDEFSGGIASPPIILNRIGGANVNDLWAVGYVINDSFWFITTPKILHWDGIDWTESYSGEMGTASQLNDVAFLSEDDVWSVGRDELEALVMHWDGSQWNKVEVEGGRFSELDVQSANDIWAVGAKIWHWDGTAWNISKEIVPFVFLSDVSAISDTDVWAVGWYDILFHGTPLARPESLTPQSDAVVHHRTVKLSWKEQDCATYYEVVLKRDSRKNAPLISTSVTEGMIKTHPLKADHFYFWRVRACEDEKCAGWSRWQRFTVEPKNSYAQ